MWTLLFLFGYNVHDTQIVTLPYFENREACISAGTNLTKSAVKQGRFYNPQALCVPSR